MILGLHSGFNHIQHVVKQPLWQINKVQISDFGFWQLTTCQTTVHCSLNSFEWLNNVNYISVFSQTKFFSILLSQTLHPRGVVMWCLMCGRGSGCGQCVCGAGEFGENKYRRVVTVEYSPLLVFCLFLTLFSPHEYVSNGSKKSPLSQFVFQRSRNSTLYGMRIREMIVPIVCVCQQHTYYAAQYAPLFKVKRGPVEILAPPP